MLLCGVKRAQASSQVGVMDFRIDQFRRNRIRNRPFTFEITGSRSIYASDSVKDLHCENSIQLSSLCPVNVASLILEVMGSNPLGRPVLNRFDFRIGPVSQLQVKTVVHA